MIEFEPQCRDLSPVIEGLEVLHRWRAGAEVGSLVKSISPSAREFLGLPAKPERRARGILPVKPERRARGILPVKPERRARGFADARRKLGALVGRVPAQQIAELEARLNRLA